MAKLLHGSKKVLIFAPTKERYDMNDKTSILKRGITDLLPDSGNDPNLAVDVDAAVDNALSEERMALSASDLARIRLRKRKEARRAEKRTEEEHRKVAEELQLVEDAAKCPEAVEFLAGGESDISAASRGTMRKDVVKLLDSLNINASLYLTRSDTYNLLSCLLTCNERQLDAIYRNDLTPLAIKTVVKRLREDARLGNIETLERLWDRVFGKGVATADLQLPDAAASTPGIVPRTLVSREAYMVIRETVLGTK